MKEGDRVEIGSNPTIKVGEGFMFFKPYASVSRTLSDDVAGDMTALAGELRKQLFRVLRGEIDFVNTVYSALGADADVEALQKLCEKELANGEGNVSFKVTGAGEGSSEGDDQGEGSVKSKPQSQPKIKVGKPPKSNLSGLVKVGDKYTKPVC